MQILFLYSHNICTGHNLFSIITQKNVTHFLVNIIRCHYELHTVLGNSNLFCSFISTTPLSLIFRHMYRIATLYCMSASALWHDVYLPLLTSQL